jgi:type I restriction enzyme S subunit
MIDALKPYPEYKKFQASWLEEIPAHWETMPGFAAFRENQTKNVGMAEKQVLSLSYGRIITKSVEKLHGLVPESFETYQIVNPGDIIIRGTDLQNDHTSLRVGLVRNRGIITSAYICLQATAQVVQEYGYQLLHTLDLTKVFYGLGSGLRQNLSFLDFKRLPLFMPPPDEQAAIVRFLDHATRRLDKAIRDKRKIIALLNEQKQAIIHRAVTRGLDPDVPLKDSGIPWLGQIPVHWEVLALKRVLRRLIDCEHKTAPKVDESDLRVVRTTGIRHGRLVFKGTYGTTNEAFEQWIRRGIPETGDVMFTREAPAGEACVVPHGLKLCLGQRTVLMKLRPARLDPDFLVHSIYGGPPRTAIMLASQGSTVGHFNMSDIGALTILLPPISEQVAIVDNVRAETAPIETTINRIEREIELLREYRTRLIADVVTGKLDVREAAARLPNEEAIIEPDVAELEESGDELVEEDA